MGSSRSRAAVAVDKEGSELSNCAPISASGESKKKEKEPENGEEELGKSDEMKEEGKGALVKKFPMKKLKAKRGVVLMKKKMMVR